MNDAIDRQFPAIRFYAENHDFNHTLALYLISNDPELVGNRGTRAIAAPIKLEPRFFGDHLVAVGFEPTMEMSSRTAKALMDAMWESGIRPTIKDRDPQAQIEAIKYHLEDMRKLVFK